VETINLLPVVWTTFSTFAAATIFNNALTSLFAVAIAVGLIDNEREPFVSGKPVFLLK